MSLITLHQVDQTSFREAFCVDVFQTLVPVLRWIFWIHSLSYTRMCIASKMAQTYVHDHLQCTRWVLWLHVVL